MKNFKALKTRRKTRTVMIGNVGIGGDNPVRVQTMANTDTLDIKATVAQIEKCVKAGAELVRVTVPSVKHAEAICDIKKGLAKNKINVPIIADVHFSKAAAIAALKYADKVRLNPGNFLDQRFFKFKEYTDKTYGQELARIEKELIPFIEKCKKAKIFLRIGANHGSLSGRILSRYGNTPLGMVESAMEYLRVFKKHDFNKIIAAMKSSNPLVMIEANRLLANKMDQEKMDYPIHLGVTEAGNAEEGRIKSAIGIGTLLLEGIGDTIRVSLTEDPVREISVCYNILQATHRRITKTEFISCPSCGRTLFDIENVTNKIKQRLGNLKGVRIAIMGCIVNGPGEMGDADFGYIGSVPGKVNLYYKNKLVINNIAQEEALEALVRLVNEKLGIKK